MAFRVRGPFAICALVHDIFVIETGRQAFFSLALVQKI